jgi:dTDP-4-dehydrorhamnose reductase
MKILVLGSKGQLGQCLNDQLAITGHDVVYTSRVEIDIADFEATRTQILCIAPHVVINATAYTAVDKAEEDQIEADLINHLAVANIARICSQIDSWLIHVSTDYVFDGVSDVPYKEDDKTNPQCVYGKTKLKGEMAIQSLGGRHIIIRTAWVFSEYGNNFLKSMLRLGAERDELSVVDDQIGCPTYAQDIAKAIGMMLPQLNTREGLVGIYHYCGDEPCSWYDYAQFIFERAARAEIKTPGRVSAVRTADYPTAAQRPFYSVLDCGSLNLEFGVPPSDWRDGVQRVIDKIRTD